MSGTLLGTQWGSITISGFGIVFDSFKNEEAAATHKDIGVLFNINGQTTLEQMKLMYVLHTIAVTWPPSIRDAEM